MPTVEALKRLQGLVERLLPLGDARPGEPVRAEDWNTLVGALIDVARVAITETGLADAVPPHDHPDQVKLSWLDPALRATLGSGGGLGAAATETRVGRTILDIGRIARRVEASDTDVATLRDRLTAFASRDLMREADVTQLRRNVEQASGSTAEDVQLLRRQLDSVAVDVTRAVGAADRLTVDGQLVDVGALVTKLASVEKLRDALTLPTGELFTAGNLEQRLSALTNTLVTEAELDTALKDRRSELDSAQIDALTERLSLDVRTRMTGDLDTLRKELTARTDERLAGVDATVRRQIEEASPGLRTGLESAVDARMAAALADARTSLLAENEKQIAAASGRMSAELNAAVDGVRASIGGVVDKSLSALLPDRFADLEARFAGLAGRVDGAEASVKRVDTAIGSVNGRLGDLTIELRNGIGGIQTRLTTETAAIRADIGAARTEVDGKIAASETRQGTRLDTRLTETTTVFNKRIDATKLGATDVRVVRPIG